MAKDKSRLGESLERLASYEVELKSCDAAMRYQLLSAWKEQILEDCVATLRALDDVRSISNIDRAIALSREIHWL